MKRTLTLASVTAVAVVVLAVTVIAVTVIAVAFGRNDDSSVAATDSTPTRPPDTAVVAHKDLVEDTEVDGTLGFGSVETLPNLMSGVVTWLPEPGQVMELGDVLYEIDGRPIMLFEGDTPLYRSLNSRTGDGADVLRLEELLVELGHAAEGSLAVDGDFTSATATAIQSWEESLGIEQTGAVALGSIVYRTDSFRISAVNATVGQQVNGGTILSITDTERLVTVLLDTSLTGLLEEGQVVEVELTDGDAVAGTVTFVSNVAVTEGQGPNATSYIEVEIVLGGGTGVDESPVTVRVEEVLENDAVVVPIASLLALAEGGYAVEVIEDDGSIRLTAVTLGTFLANEVSITGDVTPGETVVVP